MESTSTAKSPLLVIDTCIIIEAHRHGVWKSLLRGRQVVVPETTFGEALQKTSEREFDDIDVQLDAELGEGLIVSPSLRASELGVVTETSGPLFRGEWHAAEKECVAYALSGRDGPSQVCSSDKVVFRYLGWIDKEDVGISLEEVLKDTFGAKRSLPEKLTKAFRLYWTKKGFAEAFQSGRIDL